MTYACVVVGTDGSATAERAVRHGAELAAVDDARMVVVTAYESEHRTAMEHLAGHRPRPARPHRQASAPGRPALDADRPRPGRRRGPAGPRRSPTRPGSAAWSSRATTATPPRSCIDAARFYDADLLVVGSVGLVGAKRFLLGSVATSVLHHAPCDVLVVDTDLRRRTMGGVARPASAVMPPSTGMTAPVR